MSFLIYVAENASVFYKSNGKSNLDNIKETKAYHILIWGSHQKDYEENINEYYESLK